MGAVWLWLEQGGSYVMLSPPLQQRCCAHSYHLRLSEAPASLMRCEGAVCTSCNRSVAEGAEVADGPMIGC